MTNRNLVRISKFLSLVLRHKPETIGLSLDRGGWASVNELLEKAKPAGVPLDEETLQQVVERGDKQRFTLNEDGSKIRANYGHSIPVDLDLEPRTPPGLLYHGTAARFLDSIRQRGLIPKKRNYVHLSPDEETAIEVGRRHGKPIVLPIQAHRMHQHGFEFYRSTDGVWLTAKVPAGYIIFNSI